MDQILGLLFLSVLVQSGISSSGSGSKLPQVGLFNIAGRRAINGQWILMEINGD